jgi:O-antigen/teichoic acid export membrane protein
VIARLRSIWGHGDVRHLVDGGRFKLLKTGTELVASFGFTWYLANRAGDHVFDEFVYLTSLLSMLSICAYMGISDSMTRSVARGFDSSFTRGVSFASRVALSGTAILLGIAAYYYHAGNTDRAMGVLICALFFPVFRPLEGFSPFLNGRQEFGREARYFSSLTLGRIAAGLLATLLFPGIAWTVMLAYLGTHLILAGFFCMQCRKRVVDKREDPELIGYGAFTTLVSGIVMLENNFDKVIVGTLGQPEQIGMLYLALMPYSKLRSVIIPLLSVFSARFATGRTQVTGRKLLYLLGAGAAFAVGAAVFMTFLLHFFFVDYRDAIPLAQLVSLVLVATPMNLLFNNYYRAIAFRKAILVPTLSSRLLTLALVIPAWYVAGLWGLVLLKFLEQGIVLVLHFYYWRRVPGSDPRP